MENSMKTFLFFLEPFPSMSYYAWNWSKSLCAVVGVVGVVCKPIIVFSLVQSEQLA